MCVVVDLLQEVRDMELLLQSKVKERDILKGFKVQKVYINNSQCMHIYIVCYPGSELCTLNLCVIANVGEGVYG